MYRLRACTVQAARPPCAMGIDSAREDGGSMELLRGLQSLRAAQPGCVATIGNFDGVHLGHAAVIGSVIDKARRENLLASVVTFEPLPQEFLRPQHAPPRLMRLRSKYRRIACLGVHRLLVLNFNAALAQHEPRAFVERVLLDGLNVKHLVVGDDFRFGKGRRGDMALLRELATTHDFEVAATETFCSGAERVRSWIHSSVIRSTCLPSSRRPSAVSLQ